MCLCLSWAGIRHISSRPLPNRTPPIYPILRPVNRRPLSARLLLPSRPPPSPPRKRPSSILEIASTRTPLPNEELPSSSQLRPHGICPGFAWAPDPAVTLYWSGRGSDSTALFVVHPCNDSSPSPRPVDDRCIHPALSIAHGRLRTTTTSWTIAAVLSPSQRQDVRHIA